MTFLLELVLSKPEFEEMEILTNFRALKDTGAMSKNVKNNLTT